MKYIHKESKKTYNVILRDVKMKVDGGWTDAIMYTREKDNGNETIFVRSKEEFESKFEKQ